MSTPETIINIAVLEARLKALEAAAIAKEHHIVAWLKANWVHYANFGGIAAGLLKLFGKI